MRFNQLRILVPSLLAMAVLWTSHAAADGPAPKTIKSSLSSPAEPQQTLKLPVRVVDADGNPVARVKVTPWALRSSQGHGLWRADDKLAGMNPIDALTDENGLAEVLYPKYRVVAEQIRTTAVSLQVDRPDFAYISDLHIDVPPLTDEPYEIKLTPGIPLEIRPILAGQPAELGQVFAIWSDGRSYQPGSDPAQTDDGTLRFPAMRPGKNSVLLVKMDVERATHFSKITEFELVAGEPKRIDVELEPSLRIRGQLSDDVPRPVRNGRVKTQTLPPYSGDWTRACWYSWAPIEEDGTFTIDGWPAGEPMQLIALCDGFLAASGKAPEVVKEPHDPANDPFQRPQVFYPNGDELIEVAMMPLARCVVTAIDEKDRPVAGVQVISWPNVGWWNMGSQIYCHPLVRCERLLRERDYEGAIDEAYDPPFHATTNAAGQATLELPAGRESLSINSDVYELPIFLGRRDQRVELTAGTTTQVVIRLQPRGSERLGDWDKLSGVVFGCSTREGRRICALPGVQEKMNEFARRFREAKDVRDPKLLADAYSTVAEAFDQVGDVEEAVRWRQRAAEQAALASTGEAAARDPRP